jgi:hypothetical protein
MFASRAYVRSEKRDQQHRQRQRGDRPLRRHQVQLLNRFTPTAPMTLKSSVEITRTINGIIFSISPFYCEQRQHQR